MTTTGIPQSQQEAIDNLHPELAAAAKAVYVEPEVHEAIRVLAKYGLGVFLPHKHDRDEKMIPLPYGEISSEQDLRVSFVRKECITPGGVIVGWRGGPNGEIDMASDCSWTCQCTGAHKEPPPRPRPPM